jgi:type I site-specific restriction endonuclease
MDLDIKKSLRNLGYSKLQKSLAEPEFFDSLAKVLGEGLTKTEYVDIFLDYKLYDLLNDKALRQALLTDIEMVDHLLVGTKLEGSSDAGAKIDLILDTKWGHNRISKNWLRVYNLSEEYLPKTSQKETSKYTISAKRCLYPYQKNLKNSIVNILLGEDDRLLIHMPTGAGKTRTTIEALVDYWRVKGESGNYLIWLADSEELCGQAEETFKELWELKGDSDLQLYKLWGSNSMSELSSEGGVIIASLQKLYNLMKSPKNESSKLLNHIGGRSQIVIVDEAHKSMADTYAMAI